MITINYYFSRNPRSTNNFNTVIQSLWKVSFHVMIHIDFYEEKYFNFIIKIKMYKSHVHSNLLQIIEH